MRRILLSIYLSFLIPTLNAQSFDDLEFIYVIESSPIKDQQSSGTCWSFATTSFIETEAIRLGHKSISISPIYYVPPTYLSKAEKFIEREGKSYFDAGDLTFSVMDAYKNYGAIPESVYNGIIEGDWQHDHLEMDNLLYAMVESIGTSGYGRIKPSSWKKSVESVLKAYLGSPPATFIYESELHTPQSFARKYIGIQPDDYIEITSFNHEGFYKMIDLDIPANWNDNHYLNLPLHDFESIVDAALSDGYSLAWDGDASESTFDFTIGIATLEEELESTQITQEFRQAAFEDQSTTDDHNMHIIGKAHDQKGNIFYVLKNSEGSKMMKGNVIMTRNALLLKTISLLVHKDAIPAKIINKCTFKAKN